MFTNTTMKKIIKAIGVKPLSILNKMLPKDDHIILLYSGNMGIRHNLKPLKEKMIELGIADNYNIVCVVEAKEYFGDEHSIKYVTKLQGLLLFFRSKHVFYTAGQIPIKPSKNQVVIHMNHGTSDLKACGALSNIDNGDEFYFTYMLAPSELYVPIFSKEYQCPEKNIVVCGEPMTDALFNKHVSYNLGDYKKIILWLPTFRQSSYLGYNDSSVSDIMPLIPTKDYSELNEFLAKNDCLLYVKIHTAQNTEFLDKKEYSNIILDTNDEFINKGYDLYELLPQVDALLGDYSSVSLQFLLLDKPLAFVVPDMEEYKRTRGFCFENPEKYMPGPLIKEKAGIYNFIIDVINNKDLYAEQRKKVRDQIFRYQDGNNTERVIKLSGICWD